jgi:hypothetical protein
MEKIDEWVRVGIRPPFGGSVREFDWSPGLYLSIASLELY